MEAALETSLVISSTKNQFALPITNLWASGLPEQFGLSHLIIMRGSLPALQELVDAGFHLPTMATGESIHIAIIRGHISIVKLLLKKEVAATSHASIGLGWIDIAMLHRQGRCLEIVGRYLLRKNDVGLMRRQMHRYRSRTLPEESVAWAETQPVFREITKLVSSFEARQEESDRIAVQNGSSMDVLVMTLTGKCLSIVARVESTVLQFKRPVEATEGIAAHRQCILYQGKQLESGQTLHDYGIGNGSEVHFVSRMEGGC